MPSTPTGWLLIGVAVLLLCGPMLLHGPLAQGSDMVATTHFLQGFMKAFGEGDLYPRWTDRTNRDLGAPSFVLFVPLTYYGAGAAVWLAGSLVSGYKLYLIVVSLLSGLALHALAREWIGDAKAAAIAAAVYLVLPYHVLDQYQRFALSETTAFIYFPLILLFARRVMRGTGRWSAVLLALSYAGLLATHQVSAFHFSLFLGLWLLWEARGRWNALPRVAAALVCGLLLAGPAVLPMIVEKEHANTAWQWEKPNGDVRLNFIFRDDVLPGIGIKDPVKPPVLRSAHSQLLLAGLGLLITLGLTRGAAWSQRRRDAAGLAAACAGAYLMQLELSLPVWRIVPELATIQFPWRLQTLMVLTAALLAGFGMAALDAAAPRQKSARRLSMAALGACVALNLLLAARTSYLKPFSFDDAAAADPYVTTWVDSAFTPLEFRSYREFNRMAVDLPRAAFVQGEGMVETPVWLSSRRALRVRSTAGGTVAVRTFMFPGWVATLDGAPLALKPHQPWAALSFDVPAGDHTVELRFGSTPSRRWGWAMAPVGIAGAVWLSRGGSLGRARPRPSGPRGGSGRIAEEGSPDAGAKPAPPKGRAARGRPGAAR